MRRKDAAAARAAGGLRAALIARYRREARRVTESEHPSEVYVEMFDGVADDLEAGRGVTLRARDIPEAHRPSAPPEWRYYLTEDDRLIEEGSGR
jgi:hypothetical protein